MEENQIENIRKKVRGLSKEEVEERLMEEQDIDKEFLKELRTVLEKSLNTLFEDYDYEPSGKECYDIVYKATLEFALETYEITERKHGYLREYYEELKEGTEKEIISSMSVVVSHADSRDNNKDIRAVINRMFERKYGE